MADLWKTAGPRGVGAGHVDDRGYGCGAAGGNTADERGRAVRVVAGLARDAGDAALILAMLGLDPAEARSEEAVA